MTHHQHSCSDQPSWSQWDRHRYMFYCRGDTDGCNLHYCFHSGSCHLYERRRITTHYVTNLQGFSNTTTVSWGVCCIYKNRTYSAKWFILSPLPCSFYAKQNQAIYLFIHLFKEPVQCIPTSRPMPAGIGWMDAFLVKDKLQLLMSLLMWPP